MTDDVQKSGDEISPAFWVGGDNLLAVAEGSEDGAQQAALEEVRIRVGTLLKTETVSFLLGAGTSVDCGGPLLGKVPIAIEQAIHKEGIYGGDSPRLRRWLKMFYLSVQHVVDNGSVPTSRDDILERHKAIQDGGAEPLAANFEQVLSQLYRWRAALPEKGGRLRIEGDPGVDVTAEDLESCLAVAVRALAEACHLPAPDKQAGFITYKNFLRKVLTRPLNLKRVNLFTLNYDTLVEQAADAEGIVLLDGCVGTQRRIFRPESYEQDLYFPAETTEGRVHRFDRVMHLYKLHGSISWAVEEPSIENPYGITASVGEMASEGGHLLIYPTPAKYGETLGMPYSELFRRFAGALVRPQSVLFTIGYGFGDDHVNAIIRQALSVPSFTLVVVDPAPQSEFVKRLKEQQDQRVWIAEGDVGTFSGFVQDVLPDLREEDIRKKVIATQRALSKSRSEQQGGENGGG